MCEIEMFTFKCKVHFKIGENTHQTINSCLPWEESIVGEEGQWSGRGEKERRFQLLIQDLYFYLYCLEFYNKYTLAF